MQDKRPASGRFLRGLGEVESVVVDHLFFVNTIDRNQCQGNAVRSGFGKSVLQNRQLLRISRDFGDRSGIGRCFWYGLRLVDFVSSDNEFGFEQNVVGNFGERDHRQVG